LAGYGGNLSTKKDSSIMTATTVSRGLPAPRRRVSASPGEVAQEAIDAAQRISKAASSAQVDARLLGEQSMLLIQAKIYDRSRHFLGGTQFSRNALSSLMDVHAAIMKGVKYSALSALRDALSGVQETDFANVLGVSTRTLRRQAETPTKQMPADLASKAWVLAETMAKATEIFGGKSQAVAWMNKPATGLGGQRPVDLMRTAQGTELVNDFLGRLEYGVYS
jgi:putative toxin-antitoxin system antitoxin component (TIGR02293 family)